MVFRLSLFLIPFLCLPYLYLMSRALHVHTPDPSLAMVRLTKTSPPFPQPKSKFTAQQLTRKMSSSSTSSSSFFTAPDTPGSDPLETYATEKALQKDKEKEASLLDVNVNVNDAAVLKETEAATPGPLGGNKIDKSLATRVHETATSTPGGEATMKVTPEEAERIQEAEARVVDAKDRMAATGEEAATPHLNVFP